MANYVKIATLGPSPRSVDESLSNQQITENMKAFWQSRFEQVLPDKPDLIIVPEACDRPQNISIERRRSYFHDRGDQVMDYFAQVARENQCYMVYSSIREMPDGSFRNASVVLDRKGDIAGFYHKNHVVIEETTQGRILCGSDASLINCDFGTVGCVICFDLNFEELRKRYEESRPDILLFSSMYHGGLMQEYWAYACQAYFVGAIAGPPSQIRNPFGEVVAQNTNYQDFGVGSINLDYQIAHYDHQWDRFKAMKDKYGPAVTIYDPGFVGSLMISSESDEVCVDDMIDEFGIELMDEYFERSLAHHHDPKNIESQR